MGKVTSGGRAIGRGGAAALGLLALLALLPAMAIERSGGGVALGPPELTYAAADAPCGGEPLPDPDHVITGSFGLEEEGAYVMVPFDVPQGVDALRVKYCHDQPLLAEGPGADQLTRHTLDMGIYGPRPGPGTLWGMDELRGWGGSSRPDVTLSPRGTFDPDPPPVATPETTVGYSPGPIEPGEWAVELGVAAIGQETPAEDGRVEWRIEIDLISDPSFTQPPYEPVPYDTSPARSEPGWYAGDLHVHARHSNPNDATMREAFDYAFAPLGEGAGLDFMTLSDYVVDRAWGEVGAFQGDYPGKLIIRSAEVITYQGHLINHASNELVDYRTGPILEWRDDGTLTELRGPRPPREIFARIKAAGGFTQIAHPTIFPSDVPGFANLCRGCPWDYDDDETGYSLVDGIEVATGPAGIQDAEGVDPGPNPFTVTALRFYEDAIDAEGPNSNRIAAIGVSDSHNAGERPNPVVHSPIGQATTVVRADELSEQGIADGVRAGHTYVKIWGNDGPDLRFEASGPGSGDPPAIMGDSLEADSAELTATVLNLERARAAREGAYTLSVIHDGDPIAVVPIPPGSDGFTHRFEATEPGRYRIQVDRLVTGVASIEATATPIWLDGEAEPREDVRPDRGAPGAAPDDRRRGEAREEGAPRRPPAPATGRVAARGGALPFTGHPVLWLALLGVASLLAGHRLRAIRSRR